MLSLCNSIRTGALSRRATAHDSLSLSKSLANVSGLPAGSTRVKGFWRTHLYARAHGVEASVPYTTVYPLCHVTKPERRGCAERFRSGEEPPQARKSDSLSLVSRCVSGRLGLKWRVWQSLAGPCFAGGTRSDAYTPCGRPHTARRLFRTEASNHAFGFSLLAPSCLSAW